MILLPRIKRGASHGTGSSSQHRSTTTSLLLLSLLLSASSSYLPTTQAISDSANHKNHLHKSPATAHTDTGLASASASASGAAFGPNGLPLATETKRGPADNGIVDDASASTANENLIDRDQAKVCLVVYCSFVSLFVFGASIDS